MLYMIFKCILAPSIDWWFITENDNLIFTFSLLQLFQLDIKKNNYKAKNDSR